MIDGRLVVNVHGERPRRVWVRADWAPVLWEAAQQSGERPIFRPDRTSYNRKDIPNFVEKVPRALDVPKLQLQRCRNTWIAILLAEGVPINVVAEAAGIEPEAVARLGRYLPAVSDEIKASLLGGQP